MNERGQAISQASNDNPHDAYAGRVVAGQLADLAAMRALGMAMATGLTDYATGKVSAEQAPAFAKENGCILAFARVSRAVRQIIVLEQEILGLRDLPDEQFRSTRERMDSARRAALWRSWPVDDPSDLRDAREPDDLNDYDDGPVDDVIAHIGATLTAIGASVVETLRPRGADGRFANTPNTSCPHTPPKAASCVTQAGAFRAGRASTSFHDSEVSVDPRNECGDDEPKDELRELGGTDPP